ncbi:MAG: 3-ketoacyl-ACP reductase [Clostridiales bacterium]|jgi:NAD(P)-dependent dehydrogenase (short-subunit alcohol dehydrogenase family)|nr:3-ketoacyl-ACP reductase [Clostridiales bacterium]
MRETAAVTGGSRGIGLAIARQLAADGFNIAVMAASPFEVNRKNFEGIEDFLYVQGDIACQEDRLRFVNACVERFGGMHVLVNNAGVAPKARADLLEMTEESFDHVVGINAKGTMFMSQAAAKQMLAQPMAGKKRGIIINISSCSAEAVSANRGEYCISKAGISMLTKLYADRLAPDGIFVYEVRPGVIATDMTSGVSEKYDKLFAQGFFPIARWGMPEDVAQAVSAFAGGKFLYSTGSSIDVDGGFHIKRL